MIPADSGSPPATARDHLLASLWLCLMLLLLGLVVVPLLRELPVGATTKTLLLAWLLVGMAMYWMYAGLGFQPLLLLQLGLFCIAALLLSTKAVLVLLGIESFSILRRTARVLILGGAGVSAVNLVALLAAPFVERARGSRPAP